MRFDVSKAEIKKANVPHELLLTNLIGNHILIFISAAGMAGSFPWLLALVPIISLSILGFTLWRARYSLRQDSWYVMCHWQICAQRSKIFILMLVMLLLMSGLGWLGYSYMGMMKEAVFALIGGVGILPVMATVLILVIMESEALYHSNLCQLPNWVVEKFPNKDVNIIEEEVLPHLT